MNKGKNFNWLKTLFIGRARDIHDNTIFHQLSLAAILAWVGLGADGLSSSCYGPEETMKALLSHPALAMFVALACVITIGVICVSYSQIIELFPSGGGGYLVASKLISPSAGVISGSALLVDYVLTIAISIAAGADALFSVLPKEWVEYKLATALFATLVLIVMNLRGVKESVIVWAPIFFIFLATHAFAMCYGFYAHIDDLPRIASTTIQDVSAANAELGWWKIGGTGGLGLGLSIARRRTEAQQGSLSVLSGEEKGAALPPPSAVGPEDRLGLWLGRCIQLLEKLLRVLVELFQAGLAAKLHLAPLEIMDEGLPHGAQLLSGDHAGRKGVGLGSCRRVPALSCIRGKQTEGQ
jgi:hypothetical protein